MDAENHDPAGNAAHFTALLDRGRREADADRPERAEELFRQVLREAHGAPAERLACSFLAKLFVRQGRCLEALMIARRMVVLSDRGGTPEDRAFAWTAVVTAVADLADYTRIDAFSRSQEAAIDAYGGRHAPALRRNMHRLRAIAAVEAGDSLRARSEVEAARPTVIDVAPPDEIREFHVVEARVEHAARRAARARAALEKALAARSPLGTNAIELAYLDTLCTLELEGATAAVTPARRLLALLASPGAASFGTAHRLGFAHRVGRILHKECGTFDDARRAFDLAGVAAAASFAELARCSGEGAHLTPVEGALVAAFHDRLAAARRRLAGDAAALLHDLVGRTPPRESPDVDLCVTCDLARLRDGSRIPFPALARSRPITGVAYGLCETCATSS